MLFGKFDKNFTITARLYLQVIRCVVVVVANLASVCHTRKWQQMS